jgi:hypothetical protein
MWFRDFLQSLQAIETSPNLDKRYYLVRRKRQSRTTVGVDRSIAIPQAEYSASCSAKAELLTAGRANLKSGIRRDRLPDLWTNDFLSYTSGRGGKPASHCSYLERSAHTHPHLKAFESRRMPASARPLY